MGGLLSNFQCCFSKPTQDDHLHFTDLTAGANLNIEAKKTYSWDVREKPPACIVDSVENCSVLRNPMGQQLIIRNCKNAQIYILDWTTSATIDDCQGCIIVVAAVGGSLFLRDTTATTLVSASTQLRLRDCSEITLFSACESDPIIESCQKVQVGPYFLYYDKIQEHFHSAKLDNFKATHWAQVYDFTPPPDMTQQNWGRIKNNPHEINVSRFISRPPSSEDAVLAQNKYFEDTTSGFEVGLKSFVPITQDSYNSQSHPTLVLLPDDPNYRVQALQIIQRPSDALLLSTSVVSSGTDGGKIALLFASDKLPGGLVNVNGANVLVTTDMTTIHRYFSNDRHG